MTMKRTDSIPEQGRTMEKKKLLLFTGYTAVILNRTVSSYIPSCHMILFLPLRWRAHETQYVNKQVCILSLCLNPRCMSPVVTLAQEGKVRRVGNHDIRCFTVACVSSVSRGCVARAARCTTCPAEEEEDQEG